MLISKKKSINNYIRLVALALTLLSVTLCVSCNREGIKGTYKGNTVTTLNGGFTMEIALALGNRKFTLRTTEHKTVTSYTGDYEIDEDGKITFGKVVSSDGIFPFEDEATYNAEKKTVRVTHFLLNKTIVLKKQ